MNVVLRALEYHNLTFTPAQYDASDLLNLPTRPFLGAGGSGIVYRVFRSQRPDELLALKVVVGIQRVIELENHFQIWQQKYAIRSVHL